MKQRHQKSIGVLAWWLSDHLDCHFAFFLCVFFFFSTRNCWLCQLWTMHTYTVHRSHKFHFSTTFSLKMGPTILFTHLKIILLQCFQFQFSVSATISSIQMEPKRNHNRIYVMGWNCVVIINPKKRSIYTLKFSVCLCLTRQVKLLHACSCCV